MYAYYEKDISELIELSKNDYILYPISYQDYKNNYMIFNKRLGETGFIMFTENKAILCYDMYPNIRIEIKNNIYYKKTDFTIFKNFNVIGKGKSELKSPLKMFLEDFKNNLVKISVTTCIYVFILFIFTKNNLTIISNINQKLIDITGIYIGMVFVFIGFFYGDKERTIDVYKKGIGDKEFYIDRYIIMTAVVVLFLSLISLVIADITRDMIPEWIFSVKILENLIKREVQSIICKVVTWLSLNLLIISFDSLVNYYLRTMRNKYFIDSINSISEDRLKNRNK